MASWPLEDQALIGAGADRLLAACMTFLAVASTSAISASVHRGSPRKQSRYFSSESGGDGALRHSLMHTFTADMVLKSCSSRRMELGPQQVCPYVLATRVPKPAEKHQPSGEIRG